MKPQRQEARERWNSIQQKHLHPEDAQKTWIRAKDLDG